MRMVFDAAYLGPANVVTWADRTPVRVSDPYGPGGPVFDVNALAPHAGLRIHKVDAADRFPLEDAVMFYDLLGVPVPGSGWLHPFEAYLRACSFARASPLQERQDPARTITAAIRDNWRQARSRIAGNVFDIDNFAFLFGRLCPTLPELEVRSVADAHALTPRWTTRSGKPDMPVGRHTSWHPRRSLERWLIDEGSKASRRHAGTSLEWEAMRGGDAETFGRAVNAALADDAAKAAAHLRRWATETLADRARWPRFALGFMHPGAGVHDTAAGVLFDVVELFGGHVASSGRLHVAVGSAPAPIAAHLRDEAYTHPVWPVRGVALRNAPADDRVTAMTIAEVGGVNASFDDGVAAAELLGD